MRMFVKERRSPGVLGRRALHGKLNLLGPAPTGEAKKAASQLPVFVRMSSYERVEHAQQQYYVGSISF